MSEQKTISPRAWAELMLLGLIWGGSFLATHQALSEVPVITVVLHRTFWAMLILWGVVMWMRLPVPLDRRTLVGFTVMGLANNVIPFFLLTWAQVHIETGLTSIMNAATAIFGVALAALFFADEKLTLKKALGVGLGFAGVVTALGPDALRHFDLRSTAQLAALGAAFSYGLASCWARVRLGHLPPQLAAAGMLTASTLILLPVALFLDGPVRFDLEIGTWVAIAYYSVAGTALAFLLYYRVLAMAGSGNLMLVTLIVPPLAIVLGALFLGEELPNRAYAGFALLACGLMILNAGSRAARTAAIDPARPSD